MKTFARYILIQFIVIACAGIVPAQSVSTGTSVKIDVSENARAAFPKLLWEKKLARPLTSFAMSKDGEKIAIADETGVLTLYNRKGEKLWDYYYDGRIPKQIFDFAPDKSKASTAMTDVAFSGSGKYMVFEVSVLNTYKPCPEGPVDGCQVYRPYEKMVFNSDGKLLWQTSRKGMHQFGGDEYILINPVDIEETSEYCLLNLKGQVLFTGNVTGMCEEGGLSEDGRYLYMCDKLIDPKNGRTVWELAEKDREFKGVFKDFAILSNTYSGNTRRYIYEIATRKQILDLGIPANMAMTGNYVAWSKWKGGPTPLTVTEIRANRTLYTFDKSDIGRIIGATDKHILSASDENMQMYDITGRKIWRVPAKTRRGYAIYGGYVSQKFKFYSVSENTEFILFGQDKSMKLYKSF